MNKHGSRFLMLTRIFTILVISSMFVGQLSPAMPVHAAGASIIQTFFLPMPEDMVLASFKKIANSAPAAPMHSVTGISVTVASTVIYYDQWENGYELDLANPASIYNSSTNLGGTQVWGNGLAADGCPPNIDGKTALTCSDANDKLTSGDVIVMDNNIPLPRTSTVLFDARDKIGSTKVIAVTRSVWANTPGTVLGDAIEVYDTTRWGTTYEAPVGQNTVASLMFSYTSLLVSASQNTTTVTIDTDGNGTVDLTKVLNQGEVYQVDGGINVAAKVVADKPVQVDLLTGKTASTYASRWFQVPPNTQWTTSLWTAVGTTVATYPADVFVYNPNATSMTVNYDTKTSSGSFSVPAKGNYRFEMPLLSGAHFYSLTGTPFVAVGTMDSSVSGANQTYDWGYTLVPDSWLTTAFVAGWAPGTAGLTANGSPVWVTATRPTTIYVDYGSPAPLAPNFAPSGQRYDVSYVVGQFESKQIYGVGNTQTGMKVFTVDGTSITGAWGEDPAKASAGTPFLDVGYTIPPLPEVVLTKEAVVAPGFDVNLNGKVDPGDTIQYTVKVRNNGAVTAFNTSVTDAVPLHTTYVAGSTTLNGAAYPDDAAGSAFPLDGAGIVLDTILVGNTSAITYKLLADPPSPAYSSITNTANAMVNGSPLTFTLVTPVNSSATACALTFADASKAAVTSYLQAGSVYVKLTDADTKGKGPISVQVVDALTGDREPISLVETGSNSGIYVNTSALPLSTTAGQNAQDGTLYTAPGNTLSVRYTDPVYGDLCNASASITSASKVKTLYMDAPNQGLTRIDPVSNADNSTQVSTYQLSTTTGPITTTVNFTANKDTYIRASSPTNNYGSSTTLYTDVTSSPRRILLQFDTSSIPAGATITNATLSLYKTSGTTNSQLTTDVYQVTSAWDEGTASGATGYASWNNAKLGVPWTAGGDYNGTLVASTTPPISNNGTGTTSSLSGE